MKTATLLLAVTLAFANNYDNGGTDWSGLCGTGTEQSPINIDPDEVKTENKFTLNFWELKSTKGKITAKDEEFSFALADEEDAGFILATDADENEVEWEFEEFTFHSPSEHTLDGEYFDAEMQIKLADGDDVAILSIWLDTNKEEYTDNPSHDYFSTFEWEELGEEEITIPTQYFLNELKERDIYTYEGSLTVPPCTEGVRWYIFKNPQWISPNHLSYIQKAIQPTLDVATTAATGANNRAVSTTNENTVYYASANLLTTSIAFLALLLAYF